MPFDDEDSGHGGPGDPRHDKAGIGMVAAACVEMAEINAEANGLCFRCVRNTIVGRLIIRDIETMKPERRAQAIESYRGLLNSLLDGLAKMP